MSIELPVSIGEALDKLSILEIKLDKIKDERRADVQKEYDAIYGNLSHLFTRDAKFHYRILKEVNLRIWEDQDIFRESKDEKKRVELCLKIIRENDRRFRIKSKLNLLFNSQLREQKGYVKRRAFFLGHLGMGDMLTSNGIVRWLATEYEEVLVVCKRKYAENCKAMYADDPVIQLLLIDEDKDISPRFGCDLNKFRETVRGYDVYCAGYHRLDCIPKIKDIPFSFYDDVGIDREAYSTFFHCAEGEQIESPRQPYIFVANQSSGGEVFSCEAVEASLNISRNSILFINPNKNMYEESHPFYTEAEKWVGKPLLSYRSCIENASAVIVSDSSFFCLALQLEIQTEKCFYSSRDRDYRYLMKKKLFKRLAL